MFITAPRLIGLEQSSRTEESDFFCNGGNFSCDSNGSLLQSRFGCMTLCNDRLAGSHLAQTLPRSNCMAISSGE
jgi:hypothetical protein